MYNYILKSFRFHKIHLFDKIFIVLIFNTFSNECFITFTSAEISQKNGIEYQKDYVNLNCFSISIIKQLNN